MPVNAGLIQVDDGLRIVAFLDVLGGVFEEVAQSLLIASGGDLPCLQSLHHVVGVNDLNLRVVGGRGCHDLERRRRSRTDQITDDQCQRIGALDIRRVGRLPCLGSFASRSRSNRCCPRQA